VFHVISRCLNHEFLIDGTRDRAKYLALVGSALERCDATVLAYCLMSNHVHLVVRAGNDPLGRLVKPINTGYALWKNRHAGRLGPVFAGRFASPLVDADEHLLELVRYVHNNPVRAGITTRAEACDWSSHRAYLGLAEAPGWLNVGEVLSRFDALPDAARRAFASFVEEGAGEPSSVDLSGMTAGSTAKTVATDVGDGWRISHPIVGDEEFARRVFSDLQRREGTREGKVGGKHARRPGIDELVAYTCAALGLEDWEFAEHSKRRRSRTARQVITWLWVQVFSGRQADIARALNTTSANVSNWYGRAVRNLVDLQPVIDAVLDSLPRDAPFIEWDTSQRVHFRLVARQE